MRWDRDRILRLQAIEPFKWDLEFQTYQNSYKLWHNVLFAFVCDVFLTILFNNSRALPYSLEGEAVF